MTSIRIAAELQYHVEQPSSFALSVTAARTTQQIVTAELIDVTPQRELSLVPYGAGTHQLLRFDAPTGDFAVRYEAVVTLDDDPVDPSSLSEYSFREIPADVMPYLNPSRYCESDKIGRFAARLFGSTEPGYARVKAVADWVLDNVAYEPGATDGSSGTTDVLLQRAGVCRDFAHVSISLCRALGIPARYVSGYGVGVHPQDFHGFFEAFIGGSWYLFDPTGMTPVHQLVRIGFGRDAADTPFATFVGDAALTEKHVTVDLVDEARPEPLAASTA